VKLNLPPTVSTPQDVTALLLELHQYAKWFAHNSIKAQLNSKAASKPPALSESAMAVIRSSTGKELLNQKTLEELIATLDAHRSTAETISITLAAPATADVKKALVGWCRDNISGEILVSFQINSSLLGGMVVRYGSHIHDFSFRRQILANKQQFAEVLSRV
jgi:F0F1-type ATP synthase delta subunit